MRSPYEMVEEFHQVYGLTIDGPVTQDLIELRWDLLEEEFNEVISEITLPHLIDKPKLTKELADLMYVIIGTAISLGLPLEEVFAETHKSNMSKLGDDRRPIYREDGKVLKGPNYEPPNLEQFFA